MAAANRGTFNIVQLANINGSTWTAVKVPDGMVRAQNLIIQNVDGSTDLSISTNADGTAPATIPKSTERVIAISAITRGFAPGEDVFYLKGGVSTQPIVWFLA